MTNEEVTTVHLGNSVSITLYRGMLLQRLQVGMDDFCINGEILGKTTGRTAIDSYQFESR